MQPLPPIGEGWSIIGSNWIVIPAKAGIQGYRTAACPPDQVRGRLWTPAFAGVTGVCLSNPILL